MIRHSIYLILTLGVLPVSHAEIRELTDENFSDEIAKYQMALVIFHAPWCGQCRKLMVKLPEIDSKMQEFPQPVSILTVNCENEGKSTCDRYHIGGFPILKSFLKGKEYGKFEGSREVDEIVDFMRIESSPVAQMLLDFRDLEGALKQEKRVSVVGNLKEGSDLESTFFELAEKLRKKIRFLYRHTPDEHVWIKVYRLPKLWNKFEEHFVEYAGDESASSIEDFILKNYHGLVGLRTFSNKNEFNFPLVTAYYNIDYGNNAKLTNYWRNRILKIATKYKDKFNFAISSKDEFNDDLRDLGVQYLTSDKPIIVVVLESNEKFILSDNFSVETFDTFLHKILHKSVNPYLKSQKPPEKNDSYIVVAVGSTFYDIVVRNSNDTMVKIYAEWCGHCKKLQPTYRKLAKLMCDENITFVEIDGTENDVPVAYTPTGYPTIYWSTKDNRMSPILYKGDRSMEDFIKFIARHSSSELKNYDRDGNLKGVKTEL
ncbi:protein disulfide-isomerase A3-like [Coccinella septempunctata]|uniref:protein disulfide-isomerase A3-like n=1 Tax=Coccinella septempunctata TaxID=41139 RepID=UPI001D06374A|nr:protein disulfide-isomerase A3-like [Coccinella septempunctata]XP_044754600.1 protein disulfide-isomerase A3-like [Coccinella septempunctata]